MTKQKTKGGSAKKQRPAATGPVDAPKTKLGRLESMLRRKEGATVAQIATALHWQPHSVRGAISGSLKKKQSLTITNQPNDDGHRVYRIT